MHPKVLSEDGWKTVRGLVADGLLESRTLAGGTGLALQLGHRYSEDLDFFRPVPFDADRLAVKLSGIAETIIQSRSADTLHAVVASLRIGFLRAEAPLLFPRIDYRGLTIADPRDIAIMRVVAIGGRGSRKDFVDLYFYLQAGGTLEGIFSLIDRRFEGLDYNEYHLLKSLAHFDDAESEPMPRMIRHVKWETIRSALEAEVRRLS